MSRDLDRRITALEGGHHAKALNAWQPILRELPDAGLDALHDLMTNYETNPTDPSVMAAGAAGILERFAPDAVTLKRWLQAVGAT
jgi:hypothetical protein